MTYFVHLTRWSASKAYLMFGDFKTTKGLNYLDSPSSLGLEAASPGETKHVWGISAKFPTYNTRNKKIAIQFSYKHDKPKTCSGNALSLFDSTFDQDKFAEDLTEGRYLRISTEACDKKRPSRWTLNFSHNGKELKQVSDILIEPFKDAFTHVYTLTIDKSGFELYYDGVSKKKFTLEDLGLTNPEKIPDPDAVQPADWPQKWIPDPEDTKPLSWDDEPEMHPDPTAEKPFDWDDDLDGEYQAPLVKNPNFRGEFVPEMIQNPEWKEYKAPEIDNSRYIKPENLYAFENLSAIGYDTWQIDDFGGQIDNILITDEVQKALENAATIAKERQQAEQNMAQQVKDEL